MNGDSGDSVIGTRLRLAERGERRRSNAKGIKPTLIIGMGGSGTRVALELKRRIIDIYKQVPPLIRFICIDTDFGYIRDLGGEDITLSENEILAITKFDANDYVRTHQNEPYLRDWWDPDTPTRVIMDGAGQVRPIGRLAMSVFSRQIRNRIDSIMKTISSPEAESETRRLGFSVLPSTGRAFYFISSLAGGTGSGIFLDMAYLVRSIFSHNPLDEYICVSILPEVFPLGPALHANTYAAMKELEYFSTGQHEFTASYGHGQTIRFSKEPPFDLIFLIDNQNQMGKTIPSIEQLSRIISQSLLLTILNPVDTKARSQYDNAKSALSQPMPGTNKLPLCSTLGTASLIYPRERLVEYCVNRYGRKFMDRVLLYQVSDADKEAVLQIEQTYINTCYLDDIKGKSLMQVIRSKAKVNPSINPSLFDRVRPSELKTRLQAYLTDIESRNHPDFMNKIERAAEQVRLELKKRLHDEVNNILDSDNRGVLFALEFLEKLGSYLTSMNVSSVEELSDRDRDKKAAGVAREAATELAEMADLSMQAIKDKFRRALATRLADIESLSNLIWRLLRWGQISDEKKRFLMTMQAYNNAVIEQSCWQEMRRTVAILSGEVDNLRKKLGDTRLALESLREEFNTRELVLQHTEEGGALKEFERSVLSPEDFESIYKDKIRTAAGQLAEVARTAKRAAHEWICAPKEEVRSIIEDHARKVFKSLEATTIEDVFKNMSKEEIENILSELDALSNPFLNFKIHDCNNHPMGLPIVISILGVFDEEKSVLTEPAQARGWSVGSIGDKTRIIMYQQYHGIPFYLLDRIAVYKEAYEQKVSDNANNKAFGRIEAYHPLHLWKDFSFLDDIIPLQGSGEMYHVQNFAVGLAIGVITQVGPNYYMRPAGADDKDLFLGRGLERAIKSIIDKADLSVLLSDHIESWIRENGNRRLKDKIEQWLNETARPNQDYKDMQRELRNTLRIYMNEINV